MGFIQVYEYDMILLSRLDSWPTVHAKQRDGSNGKLTVG